jgi:hypothetical protein
VSETPPPTEPAVVDLTEEPGESEPKFGLDEAPVTVRDEPDRAFQRQISSRQEWVRTWLASGAFFALVVVLVLLLLAVYRGITVDNMEKVATTVVTPLTGIVGTIIGFYFAERRGGTP